MMRLIFLFYAEETDLLPMSEPLYVERYATSSLRDRLQAVADEYGEKSLRAPMTVGPAALGLACSLRRSRARRHGDLPLRRQLVRP